MLMLKHKIYYPNMVPKVGFPIQKWFLGNNVSYSRKYGGVNTEDDASYVSIQCVSASQTPKIALPKWNNVVKYYIITPKLGFPIQLLVLTDKLGGTTCSFRAAAVPSIGSAILNTSMNRPNHFRDVLLWTFPDLWSQWLPTFRNCASGPAGMFCVAATREIFLLQRLPKVWAQWPQTEIVDMWSTAVATGKVPIRLRKACESVRAHPPLI
jgi:hypothetical protein